MLNKCYCATCIGVEAVVVTVEVDLSVGVGIHLVGLPDSAVRESLLRVVTALTSYGFRIPGRKLVVNLAPADIRKEGSAYDLAIAIGLLAVSEQIRVVDGEKFLIMGELALDGRIRPVAGVLPVALQARESGFAGCIFPAASALEAAEVDNLAIYGVSTLAEAIGVLTDRSQCDHLRVRSRGSMADFAPSGNDFRQVRGQQLAKRGLEIAAAGAHNLILVGSPGSGKSLMASCLPSILPAMTRDEAIETGKVYSVAGRGRVGGLMRERPFRAPHHSASLVSLIGGGQNAAPGEISLAHNGVLYLDEMAQFSRSLLDALRQPLEDGKVTISRAKYKVDYPAHFMLVASMNPCPCGYYGDDSSRCTCTRGAVEGYLSRISGPMMDRIDLQIWVKSLSAVELLGLSSGGSDSLPQEESSAVIAARVARARAVQAKRFAGEAIYTNAAMNARLIERFCPLSDVCRNTLEKILDRMGLSARAYTRILKVARTIADLAGETDIQPAHLLEAAGFRFLDRRRS